MDVRVEIGGVDIKFFKTVELQDVLIRDHHQDTLFFIPALGMDYKGYQKETKKITFSDVYINDLIFHLRTYYEEDESNLRKIMNHLQPEGDPIENPTTVFFEHVQLNNTYFSFINHNYDNSIDGVDFEDIEIPDSNVKIENLKIVADTIQGNILHAELTEKSGFILNDLYSEVLITRDFMDYKKTAITTPHSSVHVDLLFEHDSWLDYNDFIPTVPLDGKLQNTRVSLKDIAYFAPQIKGMEDEITIKKGSAQGVVERLQCSDLEFELYDRTRFLGDIDFDGLPDPQKTFVNFKVNHLETDYHDLVRVPVPPFKDKERLKLTQNIERLGKMEFRGSFTGFLEDFVSYGKLQTALGDVTMDIALVYDDSLKQNSYKGRVRVDNFHVGKFYDIKDLGRSTASVRIEGAGLALDDIAANMQGKIHKFTFRNYAYSKIDVDGYVENKLFQGNLKSNDPGVMLDFNGKVNYRGQTPVYSFEALLFHLDPDLLNLMEFEKYTSIAADISCEVSGSNLDDMKGTLDINDAIYCYGDSIYEFYDMELLAITDENHRLLKLISDHADIEAEGDFSLYNIHLPVMNMIADALPSSGLERKTLSRKQIFDFEADIKDVNHFTELFIPALEINSEFKVHGFSNSNTNQYEVTVTGEDLSFNGRHFKGVYFESSTLTDIVYIKADFDTLTILPRVDLSNFSLRSKAHADNLQTTVSWDNQERKTRGEIKGLGYFLADRFEFDILPSSFSIKEDTWQIDDASHVVIRGKNIEISNFEILSKDQRVSVNGKISEKEEDRMNILVQNFEMSNLNPFMVDQGVSFEGNVNINGFFANPFNDLIFAAETQIDTFFINSREIGNIEAIARWDHPTRKINLHGEVERDDVRQIDFNGHFLVDQKEDNFYLDTNLDQFDAGFLNAFMDFGITEISGLASGNVQVTGTPGKPKLKGLLSLEEGAMSIEYLNTRYFFETDVFIENDLFGFDYVRVSDESKKQKGYATGTVLHNNFRDWNYDIFVEMDNILAINTTREMNSLFYGVGYASGTFSIFGYDNHVDMTINAKTEKNTQMNIPLSESDDVITSDFVTFIDPEEKFKSEVEDRLDLSGINMTFNLTATPDAEVQIIFDEQIGDVMKGKGSGNLKMEINPAGEFQMFGQYEVHEGDYLFTLQNVINKRFVVERGGTIRWFGDPYDAEINLNAIYKLRTSLYEVMRLSGNQEAYRRRVPVDLVMKLSNRLMAPDINFEIRLPSVDENTRGILQSTLATEEELNRQVFSLLVLNKFLPPADGQGTFAVADQGIGATTSSELLSNQLNNWISQISGDFDIGLNYRPGDNISNEELAVALSTQLFNERLAISGNFGVSSGNEHNQNPNSLIGDVLIEYMLTEDRKLRLKAFNESNDFDLTRTDQSLYTQGVGVYYQEEFDNRKELFCNLRNLFRRKGRNKDCSRIPTRKEKAKEEEE